jgi:hypothetical protein
MKCLCLSQCADPDASLLDKDMHENFKSHLVMITFYFSILYGLIFFRMHLTIVILLSRQFEPQPTRCQPASRGKYSLEMEVNNTPRAQNQFRQLLSEQHCVRNKGVSTFQLLQYGNAVTNSQMLTP